MENFRLEVVRYVSKLQKASLASYEICSLHTLALQSHARRNLRESSHKDHAWSSKQEPSSADLHSKVLLRTSESEIFTAPGKGIIGGDLRALETAARVKPHASSIPLFSLA